MTDDSDLVSGGCVQFRTWCDWTVISSFLFFSFSSLANSHGAPFEEMDIWDMGYMSVH